MNYIPIIGAEIHVELKTKSKMFCGCKNDPFGAGKPNIYTCPVCLGLPGALPVPNHKAIEDCILIGLALNCEITAVSKFDRKHYFYPDLPKGYQISQYDEPFCINGYVDTSYGRVGITRVHMEEDTAKLQHEVVDGEKVSLIDFNRSGVPLVEIVTDPDIHSAEQAKEFLKKVRDIVRALGVSDCNMEKGSMRLEANISLSPDGTLPEYKVEVKNINSFRFFGLSIDTEIKRHIEILDRGETPTQETRGWREKDGSTVSQRSKEEAKDYRYFPEPDIPPLFISRNMVASIKAQMPILPGEKIEKLLTLGVAPSAAQILSDSDKLLQYFQAALAFPGALTDKNLPKSLANDLVNKKIDTLKTSPAEYHKSLSSKKSDKITDVSVLEPMITEIIAANPDVVAEYKAGKTTVIAFFIGQAMKATGGKADPQTTAMLFQNLLK